MIDTDELEKFIIRRAYRCGAVSRADVIKASNASSATATRAITNTLAKFGHLLERKGRDIIVKPLAPCPPFANEKDLLKHIDCGQHDALTTGLFDKELPITYVSWTNSMPPQEGIFLTIVKAIQREKQISIVYLGLKKDQQPQNRQILPLSLEKMNDQWRVIAQDVTNKSFPVKVFVLPRILAASFSIDPVRVPYIKGYIDSSTELQVALNYKYNSKQKEMLEYELNVKNGKVKVATRSLHEFKRRFSNTDVSSGVIWPPLEIKE